MFEIAASNENGFDKITLKDCRSKTFADIIPSCGAVLHSFTVFQHDEPLNVIDHYDSADDFALNVAAKGFKSCKLSPFACRIGNATYAFNEKKYSIQKFLLNGSALHGLLYDAPFVETTRYADETGAGITVKYSYPATDPGFPFEYDCIVSYHLKKDNSLTLHTEIINTSKEQMPLQDGWHPYFTLGTKVDELLLKFQCKNLLVMSDTLIPTGKLLPYQDFCEWKKIGSTSFDHCFAANISGTEPLCILRNPQKKIQVEITPGANYPYLQIYTPPHRKSIAIENLSAAPDAFNNKMGLILLQPKENIIFTTTYKITPLI